MIGAVRLLWNPNPLVTDEVLIVTPLQRCEFWYEWIGESARAKQVKPRTWVTFDALLKGF